MDRDPQTTNSLALFAKLWGEGALPGQCAYGCGEGREAWARDDDPARCQNRATVLLGLGAFPFCDKCAAEPIFARMRSRRILRLEEQV